MKALVDLFGPRAARPNPSEERSHARPTQSELLRFRSVRLSLPNVTDVDAADVVTDGCVARDTL
jgi:hypothetical protein